MKNRPSTRRLLISLKEGPRLDWVSRSVTGTAPFNRIVTRPTYIAAGLTKCAHTFALLLQHGAPITHVSQQLGHRYASITMRVYARPEPSAGAYWIGWMRIGRIRPHPRRIRRRRRPSGKTR